MSSGLRRSAVENLAARLTQAVISMVTSIVVTRALGVEGKGMLALLLLGPMLFSRVFGLGTEAAVVVFGRRKGRAFAFGHGLGMAALTVPLATIGLWLALQLGLVPGRSTASVSTLVLVVGLVPILVVRGWMNGLARAADRLRQYDRALLVGALVHLPMALLLVPLYGVSGGVLAAFTASLAGALVLFPGTAGDGRAARRIGSSFRLDGPAFRFGVQEHAGNLAQYLNLRLDILLVGLLQGPSAVGLYTVAVAVAEVLFFIPDALGTVLLPRIAGAPSVDAARMTKRAGVLTLLASGLPAIALGIFGRPLIALAYGPAFGDAAVALCWLLPGAWILGLSKILTKHLSGTGHPALAARASFWSLGATIVGDLVLIPLWGIAGAAAATSFAYALHAALCLISYRRLTGDLASDGGAESVQRWIRSLLLGDGVARSEPPARVS